MRVAIIGAGVIGLTCADELIRVGHDVAVYDAHPAQGATHAAAGMISPAGEAWYGEEALLRLGLASAALWPSYAAALLDRSGVDVDLRTAGTLLVGRDRADLDQVLRTRDLLDRHGVEAQRLNRAEVLAREPVLNPRIVGGVLLPGDLSINPRTVAESLIALLGDRLVRLDARPDAVAGRCGVITSTGERHGADAVVVATGHRLDVLSAPAVRPVRGEILRAHTTDPPVHTVRALVHGRPIYVVPRAGGEVVIGATSEEHSGEPKPTVGGVLRLLQDARTLIPTLDAANILDVVCRFRPGTPDNGPLIGPTSTPGVFIAGGHHRGGVLLAPITAVAVRALLEGAEVPEAVRPFHPHRFTPTTIADESRTCAEEALTFRANDSSRRESDSSRRVSDSSALRRFWSDV